MLLDGVVLAAGKSSRMGSEKALLAVDGRSLVAHHVERYLAICRSVVVVVRPQISLRVQHALSGLAPARVDIVAVETEAPAESLSRALGQLHDISAVIVTPVDLLPPSIATLRELLAAFADPRVLAATPSHAGRGGHPVVLRRELLDGYCGSASSELPTLRQVLEGAGSRRARVEVADARVLGDFDTPADLPEVKLG